MPITFQNGGGLFAFRHRGPRRVRRADDEH